MDRRFRPIRERKLVQSGLAYLAGAWLLLQASTLVNQHFGWSGWIHLTLIVVAGVGLVATLVLAWHQGEKGRQRASGAELLMLAALFVLAGAAVALVRGRAAPATGKGSVPTAGGDRPVGVEADTAKRSTLDFGRASRRRVAVLPFDTLSGDESNEYFSDGVTEDVLTGLSTIDDLHVISLTSSMAYKDTDRTLPEIAEDLGAGTIVEDSVRRRDQTVKIVAQLIDARANRPGRARR